MSLNEYIFTCETLVFYYQNILGKSAYLVNYVRLQTYSHQLTKLTA